MRPTARWCFLVAALLLVVGCGKARSNPADSPDPNDVLAAGACFPLGHAALAESLAEPLAVGRDAFGTVYALSRASATTLLWRSWDERLIAYPVVASNQQGAVGAIYGADDGNRGFALTVIPEDNPSTLRVFHDLELAERNEGFAFTTGGTTLEVLGPEALADFTVASELSPALVVGSFRTVPDDAPGASLLVVRTGPEASDQYALFYGEGTELEQRVVLDWERVENRLSLRFELEGAEATAGLQLDSAPVTGTLQVLGEQRALQRGLSTPLGLEQLSLRCLASAPAAWLRTGPALPPAAESCAEALPLFACASTTGPRVTGEGSDLIPIEAAQVVELGSGKSQAAQDWCTGRATLLVEDARVNVRWARLESETGSHWLTVAGPELELPLELGQVVSLFSLDEPTFSWLGWDGEVRVRSVEDDTLLLWMGQRANFFELNGTGDFDLVPGPERCVTRPECGGAVSGYALAARPVAAEGLSGVGQGAQFVGYGERIRQGDYYIYNGGVESLTALPLCTYKPAGNARIAVWKAPGD